MTYEEMIQAAGGDRQKAYMDLTDRLLERLRERTGRKCVKYILELQDCEVTASKVGGVPYVPKDGDFPVNPNTGEKLFFLCQVNFAEMPRLEQYPVKGILQIFIEGSEQYGINWADQTCQDSWRILYYPDCGEAKTREQIRKLMPEITDATILPFDVPGEEFRMVFTETVMSLPSRDFHFDQLAFEIWDDLLPEEWKSYSSWLELPICEELIDHISGSGSRLGGYPGFIQSDIRSSKKEWEAYELLLQLDSEGDDVDWFLMWGDSGIANFFINPEDLKNCDFSRVIYNWDCF